MAEDRGDFANALDLAQFGHMHGAALRLHATALAYEGHGVLILGASGAGKSSLALDLMAFGAELICDDAILLEADTEGLTLRAPPERLPMIEARGIGLLNAGPLVDQAALALVLHLQDMPQPRLPATRMAMWRGHFARLLRVNARGPQTSAVVHALRHGFAPPA